MATLPASFTTRLPRGLERKQRYLRVIDHEQPLPRQRGPVPTEKTSLAEFVVDDMQTGGRHSAVGDRELARIAGVGRGRQRDGEAVAHVGITHGRSRGSHFRDEQTPQLNDRDFSRAER